jgi:hypothetical protein
MAIFRFLSEGKRKDAWAVSRAHQYFFLSLFKKREKKPQIAHISTELHHASTSLKGMYKKSVVVEFFLNKKKHFTDLDPTNFL